MRYGFIYETTNLINGKKYIGQHKRSNNHKDPDDEGYLGSGTHLVNALNKYGIENFSRRILEECDSAGELDERERYYISLYDAVNSPNYYNQAPGGSTAFPPTNGENNPFYGKHHDTHAIEKMREAGKRRVGENNPHYGIPQTERNKSAVRESNRRRAGEISITDGNITKKINKEELDHYLSLGWKRGRSYSTAHPRGYKYNCILEYNLICKSCGVEFKGSSPNIKFCKRCKNESTL